MKNNNRGLGKHFYTEWLVLIVDYYASLRNNDRVFEVLLPGVVAVICTSIYSKLGMVFVALDGMAELLPTADSVLIGFTVLLITLLLTSNGNSIDKLRGITLEKQLHGKKIDLFQGLHIQFSHSLLSEIELLIYILAYLFFKGCGMEIWIACVFLSVEIYLTLNVLMSIIRGITNIYFSFYKKDV